eukprot:1159876-Pelagomonas_calceolata.AAC.4
MRQLRPFHAYTQQAPAMSKAHSVLTLLLFPGITLRGTTRTRQMLDGCMGVWASLCEWPRTEHVCSVHFKDGRCLMGAWVYGHFCASGLGQSVCAQCNSETADA